MTRIDYREVRRRVSLWAVLNLIGYDHLHRHGNRYYGPCPLSCSAPPGPRWLSRCTSFNLKRGLWRCHRCQRGGNQLDLFMMAKGLTVYRAAAQLCALVGLDLPIVAR